MNALLIVAALLMDKLFAEPTRFHPLVGFGAWADKFEQRFNHTKATRLTGFCAWLFAVLPWVLLAYGLEYFLADVQYAFVIISAVCLYLAIGWQSLIAHGQAIRQPLLSNDLDQARKALAMIVSRDTSELSEKDIAKAASESVLENGADAIFSALFWFVIAGIPGVVFYRLCNTLDAMWGYKNKRFLHFGWAAARMDDLLNFIPARLTALTYALAGHGALALRCWRQQAFTWKSPNAGPVMAAGAGAINTSLGGDASYHGKRQQRPVLGPEESKLTAANPNSIQQAITLVNRSLVIWVLILILIEGLV